MTFQETLPIIALILSIGLIIIVGVGAWLIVKDNRKTTDAAISAAIDTRENMLFLKSLREQIGTDHGATIAKQLLDLQDAAKEASRLAAQANRDDAIVIEKARIDAERLSAVVHGLLAEQVRLAGVVDLNQKFNEYQAKAIATEIKTTINTTNTGETKSERHGGIDVRDGSTVSAGEDIGGGDKQTETKIEGVIKGTLTETGKEIK